MIRADDIIDSGLALGVGLALSIAQCCCCVHKVAVVGWVENVGRWHRAGGSSGPDFRPRQELVPFMNHQF